MISLPEVADALPAGILLVRAGTIVSANRVAEAMAGRPLEGAPVEQVIGQGPMGPEPQEVVLSGGEGTVPVLASASSLQDDEKLVVLQALNAARQGRGGCLTHRMRFLASASHDLRQPLQAMALFTSALESYGGPEMARLTSSMKVSLETMERIFERLLDLFRLEAGAFVARKDDFLASEVIEGISGAEGVRSVPSGTAVFGDRQLVRRILAVLIRAALARGGRVLAGCRRRGDHLCFEVWDNSGIALDPESRRMLSGGGEIAPAAKIDSDRLDLMIASRIAGLMGSPLTFESRPGRTWFRFTLPLSSAEE